MRRIVPVASVVLLAGLGFSSVAAANAGPLQPGRLVDYRPLAFQPEVWEQKQVSTMLLPWTGSNIVLAKRKKRIFWAVSLPR